MAVVNQKLIGPSGKAAWTCQVTGEVLHSERAFETLVSSRGGGGSVGPSGGYVAPPRITSESVEHQDLFVRDDAGVEHSFSWNSWSLPVRPGNRVSVMWGGPEGSSSGTYLFASNLDTGESREDPKGFRSFVRRGGLVADVIWMKTIYVLTFLVTAFAMFYLLASYANDRPPRWLAEYPPYNVAYAEMAKAREVTVRADRLRLTPGRYAETERVYSAYRATQRRLKEVESEFNAARQRNWTVAGALEFAATDGTKYLWWLPVVFLCSLVACMVVVQVLMSGASQHKREVAADGIRRQAGSLFAQGLLQQPAKA
ncbi:MULTISPECIES: hypothetical protein [unclassified Variovorax]|uniref:hypothetical protein n=1 Tax=unclassified Variovorax TaxID=663243 RepID=UPI001316990F|nr:MULTISPECIES: hypothetical protein [unclassified Variovorax]VTU42650.1 hypothetical protein H6P1_00244 [Variovorax sp. PBL-H6]VTU43778.1 hypothetical protein SRS16P1_00659 [Variovorax sp. SRS16]VTU43843.1 hypothetical protein E5P1_00652 [Variovorax sp. PBL-E5]